MAISFLEGLVYVAICGHSSSKVETVSRCEELTQGNGLEWGVGGSDRFHRKEEIWVCHENLHSTPVIESGKKRISGHTGGQKKKWKPKQNEGQ